MEKSKYLISMANLSNLCIMDFFFPGETVLDWNGENSLGQKVASGSHVYNLYINGDLKGSQIMTFVK